MGLEVSFANAKKVIPTVSSTDDLEYTLAAYIRQLTRATKPVIAWVSSQRDQQLRRSWQRLQESLRENYDVRAGFDLNVDTALNQGVKILVLGGSPDSFPQAQQDRVLRYLQAGGSAFVFTSGMLLSPQSEFAQPLPVTWNPILRPYGVTIQADMAYDLRSNRPIGMPTASGMRIAMPYPLWVSGLSTKVSVVNEGIEGVFLPWTSTIDTSGAKKGVVTPLFVTSRYAGVEGLRVLITPGRQYAQDSLGTRILGVQVNTHAAGDSSSGGPNGRLIVVGSTDFSVDGFTQPENQTFFHNGLDWLAQDMDLIAIRSKDRTPPRLVYGKPAVQDAAKYSNVIGVPVLLALVGAVRMFRRRRLQGRSYEAGAAA